MLMRFFAFVLVVLSWFSASPAHAELIGDRPNSQRIYVEMPPPAGFERIGRVSCSSYNFGANATKIWVQATLAPGRNGNSNKFQLPVFPVPEMTVGHAGKRVTVEGKLTPSPNSAFPFQYELKTGIPAVGSPPYRIAVEGEISPVSQDGSYTVNEQKWLSNNRVRAFTLTCSGDSNKEFEALMKKRLEKTPANNISNFKRRPNTSLSDLSNNIANAAAGAAALVLSGFEILRFLNQ
ncbi:MAG: hypothetical protein RBJ76_13095 [Stenomitos frigidus ULC029]